MRLSNGTKIIADIDETVIAQLVKSTIRLLVKSLRLYTSSITKRL